MIIINNLPRLRHDIANALSQAFGGFIPHHDTVAAAAIEIRDAQRKAATDYVKTALGGISGNDEDLRTVVQDAFVLAKGIQLVPFLPAAASPKQPVQFS